MPVTARLSRRFYDVLGEDVANELVDWFNAVDLTYRGDLRELNELNFARFDAKLEQRLAEMRAELRQEMAELRAELRAELHGLRADLLRWMFGFWATTLLTVAGLMIALRGP
jgi:hypothetical protein